MLHILELRNRSLSEDIDSLLLSIRKAQAPAELIPYRDWLVQLCEAFQAVVHRNLTYLALGQEDIVEDVLSNTQQATHIVRLVSSHLAVPVLRASRSDRLCLSTIGWLHSQHPETSGYPPAFGDGPCAIYPFVSLVPIYFFPCVQQLGLLYQPLLFHEFGHLLYARHKSEMDDLVGELQREVSEILIPASQRNDRYSEQQAPRRQVIVDTWYNWAQELFCDAVGFTIGGPCFLNAFSAFVSNMDRGDFYGEPNDLERSKHPITWLRIKLLVERAISAGFTDLARSIQSEWDTVAKIMSVEEDYHGFYDTAMAGTLSRIIRDMLIEASPRECTRSEAAGGGWAAHSDSPVRLLNWAWQVHRSSPREYAIWEAEQTELLLR